jgi:hypothetical protein
MKFSFLDDIAFASLGAPGLVFNSFKKLKYLDEENKKKKQIEDTRKKNEELRLKVQQVNPKTGQKRTPEKAAKIAKVTEESIAEGRKYSEQARKITHHFSFLGFAESASKSIPEYAKVTGLGMADLATDVATGTAETVAPLLSPLAKKPISNLAEGIRNKERDWSEGVANRMTASPDNTTGMDFNTARKVSRMGGEVGMLMTGTNAMAGKLPQLNTGSKAVNLVGNKLISNVATDIPIGQIAYNERDFGESRLQKGALDLGFGAMQAGVGTAIDVGRASKLLNMLDNAEVTGNLSKWAPEEVTKAAKDFLKRVYPDVPGEVFDKIGAKKLRKTLAEGIDTVKKMGGVDIPNNALGVFDHKTGKINIKNVNDNETLIHEVTHKNYYNLSEEQQGALDYTVRQIVDDPKNYGLFSELTDNPVENIAMVSGQYIGKKGEFGGKEISKVFNVDGGRDLVRFIKNNVNDAATNKYDLLSQPKKYFTDSSKILSQPTIPVKGGVDTFEFQDSNQEKMIRFGWKEKSLDTGGVSGPSLRHTLEGTGDIFREVTGASPGGHIDASYIAEKINRLKDFINGSSKTIDYSGDAVNLKKLRSLWEKQPVNTAQEKLAKDLNLAVIDGDFGKAQKIVNELSQPTSALPSVGGVDIPTEEAVTEAPLDKLQRLIRGAKTELGKKTKEISAERAKRIAKLSTVTEGGQAGLEKELAIMKGELSNKKLTNVLGKELSQGDIDSILNVANDSTSLTGIEKMAVKKAMLDFIKEGQIPGKQMLNTFENVYGSEFISTLKKSFTPQQAAFETLVDVVNVPRTLMASFDMSAPFRQGIVLMARHPVKSLKSGATMVKAFASEDAYEQAAKSIMENPQYQLAKNSGIQFTEYGKGVLNNREEGFVSKLAERLPLVKRSERAYTAYLNKMRMDVFADLSDKYIKLGYDPIKDANVFNDFAGFINKASGRGNLPKILEPASEVLNGLLFSPKLMASRMALLNPAYYYKMSRPAQIEAAKTMASFIGAGITVLSLAKMAGAEVESDPRSADFAKIKVGKTRYDIWGGFQQYIRFTAQQLAGETKSTTSGKITKLNSGKFGSRTRKDVLYDFVESKASPPTGAAIAFMEGQNATGDKYSVLPTKQYEGELYSRLVPLVIQDTIDAFKEEGMGGAAMTGTAAFFGIGTQTYKNKKSYKSGGSKKSYLLNSMK